jgi:fimbrial chaperone protein
MLRLKGIAAAVCLAVLMAPVSMAHARSIGVQPLLVDVAPGQNAAIRVRNSSDQPTTVDVAVGERIIDAMGVQTRTEADDRFIVFPPQATIAPNGSQVFRVQPIENNLKQSKSYFLTIQQVPVAFKPTGRPEGGAQLQVLFAFDVAVHVVPRGTKPQLEFVSATPAETVITQPNPQVNLADSNAPLPPPIVKKVPGVAITVKNLGSRYFYLQDYEFLISGTNAAGVKVDVPAPGIREVIEAAGVTLVPAGATREFKLPLPEGSALKDVSVRVRPRPRS